VHRLNLGTLIAISFVVFLPFMADAASPDQSLVITETDNSIRLSVPVSRLALVLPRGKLVSADGVRTGASASPRYFRFKDPKLGLIVSGWFEPSNSYPGFGEFWEAEFTAMKKNGLIPVSRPELVKADNWLTVAYELTAPGGINTHLRAHLVQAGTWIDMHISVTTEKPIKVARKEALAFLKSVAVTERP